MKRIFIIVASIIVVLGIAVGIYFFFFAPGASKITVGVPNPFSGSGDRPSTDPVTVGPVQGAGTVVAPHLIRITDGPVAKGAVALKIAPKPSTNASSTPEFGDTEVRYIERASGNVYAFRVHDRVLTRIGNKTLPGVQEASWLPDGTRAFARFITTREGVDQVATYSLPADGTEGYFFEAGLASAGVTPSGSIFTLLPGGSGSVASIADASGAGSRTLFSSSLSAITLAPSGADFVATTKPSSEVSGYAFLVSGKTGAFSRILGPFTGLSTLPSPNGNLVLYSYVSLGKLHTGVFDIIKRSATELPVATLSEKCAWVPDSTSLYCGVPTEQGNNLPDSWYQGASSFSDRLWKVDLATRLATLVADPAQLANIAIDMVSVTTDPVTDVVVFTNRIDGSLWAYDF